MMLDYSDESSVISRGLRRGEEESQSERGGCDDRSRVQSAQAMRQGIRAGSTNFTRRSFKGKHHRQHLDFSSLRSVLGKKKRRSVLDFRL